MTKIAPPTTSPDLLSDAIASSSVAAFVLDGTRHITTANTSAAALTGYDAHALAGLPMATLFAARSDWAQVEAMLAAETERRTLASFQSTIRQHDGTLSDVSLVFLRQFDGAGRTTGALAFMTPSGDTKRSSAPKTDSDAAMLRFARGAAHDFKNLLAIITGNVQLAASEARAKPRAAFLADAERACTTAARLANQMIAFARDRAVEPRSLSIESFFASQAAILRAAAGPAITLTFEQTAETANVRIDRSGLESALLNLVINARDAMPKGGTITVSASNADIRDADGLAQKCVAIGVRDSGAGMTKRVLQRAFDPFFSTKALSHGTGLGLATVMGFARQSGGHAEIVSEVGEGTTVTIYLPAEASR